jgi:hypothetical protein
MTGTPPRGPQDERPDEPGWWLASDGRWYPPESAAHDSAPPSNTPAPASSGSPAPAPAPASPYILTIGDIGVTPESVVTPNGTAPLRGSQWIVMDMSRTESRIPGWAIVMAVIFAFLCLVGLLFLLVKETTTTGYVEVSVRSGDLYHRTQLPVFGPESVSQIRQLVGQAQTLAAQAR